MKVWGSPGKSQNKVGQNKFKNTPEDDLATFY